MLRSTGHLVIAYHVHLQASTMSLLDSFSGENAEGLAQLRLNVYTELKILPSADMEEAWAGTRAESGTNVNSQAFHYRLPDSMYLPLRLHARTV